MNKTKTKTCYFCADWYDEEQDKVYKEAMKALKKNNTIDIENSYIPREHKYSGFRLEENPEYFKNKKMARVVSEENMKGIQNTDVYLIVYLPNQEYSDVDAGLKVIYPHTIGKYNLLVIPDDQYDDVSTDLMNREEVDNTIRISELKDFDFNNLKLKSPVDFDDIDSEFNDEEFY